MTAQHPGEAQFAIFRTLFAAYPDSLLVVDRAGAIVLANPSAATLLGYAPEELVGLSVEDLVPDSIRPRHAAYRDAYGKNPRPRPMGTQMELVARRKDGSEVMVEIALSPLMDQGLPYVVAAIRDIGAYPRVRQALQRARYAEHVSRMSRLAVDTPDPELLMREVARAAAEALEVEVAQVFLLEPGGTQFRVAGGVGMVPGEEEGAHVPNRPDTPPGFVLAQGRPVLVNDYASEQRFKTPSAYLEAGLVSALGVPLTNKGRTVGALTVRSRQPQRFGEDERTFLESLANLVTTLLQRAETEETLRHAQRLESVGQLTGGIAHDFNNLLTIIQGNLQVLEELPPVAGDEYAQQLLAAATRASQRGAELTSKLLAFSRRQVLQPRPIDTGQMLLALADMLRRTLDQRIRIQVEAPEDLPPCVADPGQLESAVLNIAINARDAMPDGGTLTFGAHLLKEPPPSLAGLAPSQAYVGIAIRDTGTGMSEEVKERAFEPFFTTKESGRGTGLGLSTVYGFATQSKGTVVLDSALGQGTTITLVLPTVAQPAAQAPARSGEAGVPSGLKVLLVEDEPEVLRVVQAFLSGWGCEVTPCGTAEQALLTLHQPGSHFDLLLSDVVLGPGMRGTELVARARAQQPGLAVLLMSGYASDLRAGSPQLTEAMPDLLRKPFRREELAAALARVLSK